MLEKKSDLARLAHNATKGDYSEYRKMHIKVMQILRLRSCGTDEQGNLLMGMVGPQVACRSCGQPRWDDGTRCAGCRAYQRSDKGAFTW